MTKANCDFNPLTLKKNYKLIIVIIVKCFLK